jgi:cytochrome c peroxidase
MALASRFAVRPVSSPYTSSLCRVSSQSLTFNEINRRRWDRRYWNQPNNNTQNLNLNNYMFPWKLIAGTVALGTLSYLMASDAEAEGKTVDYSAVREDIKNILDNEKYDDGSYGPVLIRLAWHAAGTYSKSDPKNPGGSDGATMRFEPESAHGANAGLHVARGLLEKVKNKHPDITYADLWSLSAVVAIEHMGGPKINWRPGRVDKPDGSHCTPNGRLPDADKGPEHIREIFYRMGFNDREIVALIGAHAVGRCHTDRSGYSGPWTFSPTTFSNDFFEQLLNNTWTKKKWNGPEQYEDPTGKLMMLPADLALLKDPQFKKICQEFASDESKYFKEFAGAFQKLEEAGVKALAKPWYQFW